MNIKDTFKRNSYPTRIADKVIKKYIKEKISKGNSQIIKEKDRLKVRYIKLRHIGKFSD